MSAVCEDIWHSGEFGCLFIPGLSWQWQWDVCDGPRHKPYGKCWPCSEPALTPIPCDPAPVAVEVTP